MKAGVFQCDGAGLTPEARLGKLARAVEGQSLDLVVCPELFMSGYHVGEQLHELAEPADGPFAQHAAQLARSVGTAIVYGYPERDGDSVLQLGAGHRGRWHHPCQPSQAGHSAGQRGRLVCTGPGPHAVPAWRHDLRAAHLLRRRVSRGRACRLPGRCRTVIVPTALSDQWDQVADRVMPARAFENGCWVLYANHAGAENGLAYHGGSCIVGPQGRDAARAGAAEQLITATIDAASVAAARARLPYFRDLQDLTPRLA
jgi:predicted amidohydrolase